MPCEKIKGPALHSAFHLPLESLAFYVSLRLSSGGRPPPAARLALQETDRAAPGLGTEMKTEEKQDGLTLSKPMNPSVISEQPLSGKIHFITLVMFSFVN